MAESYKADLDFLRASCLFVGGSLSKKKQEGMFNGNCESSKNHIDYIAKSTKIIMNRNFNL